MFAESRWFTDCENVWQLFGGNNGILYGTASILDVISIPAPERLWLPEHTLKNWVLEFLYIFEDNFSTVGGTLDASANCTAEVKRVTATIEVKTEVFTFCV